MVATSNSTAKIEDYLKEHFEVLQLSGGPSFAELAQERLAEIWLAEMPGLDLPHGWATGAGRETASRCVWPCGNWSGTQTVTKNAEYAVALS